MKSLKEVLFENALYCKDKAREWKESHGEFDNLPYDMYRGKYEILLTVITEAGFLPDWDAYMLTVFHLREDAKQLEKD